LPTDLLSAGSQAFPVLVAALCFADKARILTTAGRISFVLLLISAFVSLFGLLVINPEDPAMATNTTGGKSALTALYGASSFSFSTAMTYLLLLAGLSLSKEQGAT
jgi:hypothetical protein